MNDVDKFLKQIDKSIFFNKDGSSVFSGGSQSGGGDDDCTPLAAHALLHCMESNGRLLAADMYVVLSAGWEARRVESTVALRTVQPECA